MSKHRTTKTLPTPIKPKGVAKALPLSSDPNIADQKLFFSFLDFDRQHKFFNLGDVDESWFLDMLDCLQSVATMTFAQLKAGKHKMHPVDWNNVNVRKPVEHEQKEFWQFRINKSKGRVVGYKIENVFYVVWLDAHHNLSDSPGYEKATVHDAAKSDWERSLKEKEDLKKTVDEYIGLFEDCDPSRCPFHKRKN